MAEILNSAFWENSNRFNLDLLGNVHSLLFLSYFNHVVLTEVNFRHLVISSYFKQSKKKTGLLEC